MANPFKSLDEALLVPLEKILQSLEHRTGKDCFWVAKCVLSLGISSAVVACIGIAISLPKARILYVIIAVQTAVIGGIIFLLGNSFEDFYSNRSFINPARQQFWFVRVVLIGACLMVPLLPRPDGNTARAFMLVIFPLFTLYFYIFSCTPLPPGAKRKKRIRRTKVRPLLAS